MCCFSVFMLNFRVDEFLCENGCLVPIDHFTESCWIPCVMFFMMKIPSHSGMSISQDPVKFLVPDPLGFAWNGCFREEFCTL